MRQTERVQLVASQLTDFLKQHSGSATYQDYAQYRHAIGKPITAAEVGILSNITRLATGVTRVYKKHDNRVDTFWILDRNPEAVHV
ncbi:MULTISPECIES: hypothetical protein [Lacticaseibacillus]|uniref:hypothetical protein n=1 Tax=Lacticaseibacillus TaxID=2759736 RepID=UPI0006D10A58|nr:MULTISPECIES: hypothetical protein [Lacticaseibacillus]